MTLTLELAPEVEQRLRQAAEQQGVSPAEFARQLLVQHMQPRYSKEEFARRGDEIYWRDIYPQLTQADEGKFAVIDIETGAYEVDRDELAAADRLQARYPDAQVWLVEIGSRYARRFSAQRRTAVL